MFYYYGRKKKLSGRYPDPTHPVIVEPFAGSAAYSLHGDRWQRKVILVERDPEIAALWRWLIGEATPDDILGLPNPEVGDQRKGSLIVCEGTGAGWLPFQPFTTQAAMAGKQNGEVIYTRGFEDSLTLFG